MCFCVAFIMQVMDRGSSFVLGTKQRRLCTKHVTVSSNQNAGTRTLVGSEANHTFEQALEFCFFSDKKLDLAM